MNPLLLPVGRFGRIDEFLYAGALGKVALVLFPPETISSRKFWIRQP